MSLNKRIKRRIVLLVCLFLALSVVIVSVYFYSQWNRKNQIAESYAQGMAAYESGDYITALPLLSKAASSIRDDVDLIIALGNTRLRNVDPNGRHISAAEKYFLFALSLDSQNNEALMELVKIYALTGNSTNTMIYSDRIEEPTPEVIRFRVRVLNQNGRFDQALEEVARIREIEPDDPMWAIEHVGIQERMGVATALILDDIEEMMRAHPDNQGLLYSKIHILQSSGRADSAVGLLRDFAASEDIDPKIVLMLSRKLVASGMLEEQAQLALRIEEISRTDPDIAESIIDQHLKNGSYVKAMEKALQADKDFPEDLRFLRKAAGFVKQIGNQTEQEELYSNLIERSRAQDTAQAGIDERVVDVYRNWGPGNTDIGSDLIPELEELITLDYSNVFLKVMLAEAFIQTGRRDDGTRIYDDVFQRTNSRASGRRLVNLLIQTRQYEEAVTTASRLLALYPNLDSYITQNQALLALKRANGVLTGNYPGLRSGSTISKRVLDTYQKMTEESQSGSELLLPLLASAASLEEDREILAFATGEALRSEQVDHPALLLIASDPLVLEMGDATALVARAEEKGAAEFDLLSLKALHERLQGNEEKALEIIDQAYALIEGTGPEQVAQRRRVLTFIAGSTLDDQAIDRLRSVMSELQGDAASAQVVSIFPDLWKKDPDLAESALEQTRLLLGENSQAYQIALGKRVSVLEMDDEGARAKSIVALNNIVQNSPGSIDAMLILSDLLRGGTKPDLSASAGFLKRVIDIRPSQKELYPQLIQLLQMSGDRERAQEYLEQYQKIDTADAATRNRVALYVRQGQMDDAISELLKLASDSNDPLDRVYLGMFLGREGRVEEAIAQYVLAEEMDPENRFALHGKLLLLANSNRLDEALDLARSCTFLEPGELAAMEVELYIAGAQGGDALPVADKLIENRPDEIATWLVNARVRVQNGDLEAARDSYRKALEIDAENQVAREQLAPLLVADPLQWEEASRLLEGLKESNPLLTDVLMLTMDATDPETGRFSPSEEDLSRSLELIERYPGSIAPRRLAWEIHENGGRHDIGLEISIESMEKFPNSATPSLWGFQSALSSRDWDRAVEFAYSTRSRSNRNRSLVHDLRIAEICMRLGRNADAYAALAPYTDIIAEDDLLAERMSISDRKADPRNNSARRARGYLISSMIRTKRIAKARQMLDTLIDENPALVEAWLSNNAFVDRDTAINATTAISDLLQDTPEGRVREASARINIARQFDDQTQLAVAREILDGVTTDDDQLMAEIVLQRASVEDCAGNHPEAIRIIGELIASMRDSGVPGRIPSDDDDVQERRRLLKDQSLYLRALNNHAFQISKTDDQERLEEALTNIDEAIASSSGLSRANFIDTKCSVLSSLDRKAEALELMQRVIAQAPGQIGFRINTARLLIDLDRMEEARVLLNDTLDMLVTRQSTPKQAETVRELLEEAS